MTDRELLELAAKAAGKKVLFDSFGVCRDVTGMHPASNFLAAPVWNPKDDDGDALRLAVKLDIYFMVVREEGHVSAKARNGVRSYYREDIGGDEMAAARRAILRAAADIWRRQQ